MSQEPKIVAVHLLNDYSGSPRVLSTVIKNLVQRNYEVELITSGGSEGILSHLPVKYKWISYRFYHSRWLRLLVYFWSQLSIFMKIWSYNSRSVTVYINTLLPFGAALAARLRGQRVIYHLHETSLKPELLKKFLKRIAKLCADEAIYVSEFLAKEEALDGVPAKVAYNALSKDFVHKVQESATGFGRSFNVLMLCSLKGYKGVEEFIALSAELPHLTFELVLNADKQTVKEYFEDRLLPGNLYVFPAQKEVGPFYERADIVLNLSKPAEWKETFGLTLLEGMQYGIPVIAPPAGGPCEIVIHGFSGYLIHPEEQLQLVEAIHRLSTNKILYKEMSNHASQRAGEFTEEAMMTPILDCLNRSHKKELSNVSTDLLLEI